MSVKKLAVLAVLALSGCSSQVSDQLVTFDRVELGNPATTATSQPTATDPGFVVDSSASIHIDSQQGDGKSVAIEELRVGRSGTFLVIYDGNGLVLATQMVSPQSQPVNIALEAPLTKTSSLQAVLYLDNGDSIFDLRTDTPIVDAKGNLIHEDFDYTLGSNTDAEQETHDDD